LIVLSSDLYVRNFVQTGAFSKFDKENTFYIVADTVKYRGDIEMLPGWIGTVKEQQKRAKFARSVLFPYLTFAHRKDSRSFAFRAERLLHEQRKRSSRWLMRGLYLISRVLGKSLVTFLLHCYGRHKELEGYLTRTKPDIVVIPSSAIDTFGLDATMACKRLGIPSVHVINGWDNLSSKIVFPVKPDYLCVWGNQSLQFAWSVHGIDPLRVHEIGSPVFDAYDNIKRKLDLGAKLDRIYPFDYVLFAGCAVAFDEISALKILDETIERELLPVTIVYRPHPWRLPRSCPDDFFALDFKHVIMDGQVKDAYIDSKDRGTRDPSNALPDLAYYPGLLHHARFVICPLSTMLLEALYFKKDVISIEYDDGVHITSPHALRRYEHFDGIDALQGVWPCTHVSSLAMDFKNIYNLTDIFREKPLLAKQLQHYIYSDDVLYAERLLNAVNDFYIFKMRDFLHYIYHAEGRMP